MITKQQALEFIYELLKEYTLKIDVTNSHGFLEISSSRYRTEIFEAFADSLEEFMTEFIKQYLNTGIFENMDKIPVDIDMLEVGKTYKVVFNEAQITDELTKIDDNNVYFRRNYPIKIRYIREIYKVNECTD